jgi:hypothetical protein
MTKPKPIPVDAKDRQDVENYLNGTFWIYNQCDFYRQGRLVSRYHPRLWRERQRRKAGREPALILVRRRKTAAVGESDTR